MNTTTTRRTTVEVRREHLKEYILGCIRDNVLSWQDIVNGEAVDKLLRAIPNDLREVMRDLTKKGAGGLVQLGAAFLGQLGSKLTEKK